MNMDEVNVEEGFKRCSKCGEVKPLSLFYKKKSTKDGFTSCCKDCIKAMRAGYRTTHKEKIKVQQAKWYAANKEKQAARNASYYATHKEDIRKQQSEYYKEYCKANKEKIAARKAEQYANYKDPQKNPMGYAKYMVKGYRKMDRDRGFDDSKTITAEWFVQNIMYNPCAHCGLRQVGAIGVNRLKNTEGHIPSNCEPCCSSCNSRQNCKDMLERGVHISQLRKKQSFKDFVKEHKKD